MTAGVVGVRAQRSLALVASLLVMVGIVGMHMLAGSHGSAVGGGHGSNSGSATTLAVVTETVSHNGHDSAQSTSTVGAEDELTCGHQAAGHEECVLSLPWSVLPAAAPPVASQPIWLMSRPVAEVVERVVEASARSSPLLLLCICRR